MLSAQKPIILMTLESNSKIADGNIVNTAETWLAHFSGHCGGHNAAERSPTGAPPDSIHQRENVGTGPVRCDDIITCKP